MTAAPHIAALRAVVGHSLLVLPAVSVLPVSPSGEVLLVTHAGRGSTWEVLGGAVSPGERPCDAACREALEETGASVELTRLVDVLGGTEYEVTYPNGDRCAYVTALYEARFTSSLDLAAGDGELSSARWFTPGEAALAELSSFSRGCLRATGRFQGV